MILSIYYCEYLKNIVLRTINEAYSQKTDPVKRENQNFSDALRQMLVDGIINPAERDEMLKLVRYRNDIAHRIHLVAGGEGSGNYRSEFCCYCLNYGGRSCARQAALLC